MSAASNLEQTLQEYLTLLRGEVISTQDLHSQIVELRESRAAVEQRGLLKDQQISEMQEVITALHETEITLNKKIVQMELQLSDSMISQATSVKKLREELAAAHDKLKLVNESEVTVTTEVINLKETLKTCENELTAMTEQKLEVEKKVHNRRL